MVSFMPSTHQKTEFLGISFTALAGGALALNLLLILGLLLLIAYQGAIYFWQKALFEINLQDGSRILAEIHEEEPIPPTPEAPQPGSRIKLRIGNRELVGNDFRWLPMSSVVAIRQPRTAVLLERVEWGPFLGWIRELRRGEETLALGEEAAWTALGPLVKAKTRLRREIRRLEKGAIGDINLAIEQTRLEERRLELEGLPAEVLEKRRQEIQARRARLEQRYESLASELFRLRRELLAETAVFETADGRIHQVAVGNIVRALRPNEMGVASKLWLSLSKVWEFIADDPRESNTEGGIFPAIFGTVMMVFLMSFAVVPFGVVAAVYLREYAKQGPLVRVVRIAVNNLAGVPSIVYGVFGLGFFVYTIGGTIDQIFYPEALPTPTFGTGGILWAALTLALLTVPVVIVATEEGLAAVPGIVRAGSLALGATKWETTWKVVLPAAAPGILTGVILAMARASGEVAPLMIVGMVKLAPTLPIDHHFPWIHLERKFMHLGFHIYDVGFQSPNVDAAKPLVFATTFLLVALVTTLNLAAVRLRNRLRARYAGSAV
jgi:phosphate transport system permease protein